MRVIRLFVAIGLEITALHRMRSARAASVVRESLSTLASLEKALPGGAGLVLIGGPSMTLTVRGWTRAWIDSALAVPVLLGGLGPLVTGRRVTLVGVPSNRSTRVVTVSPEMEGPMGFQLRVPAYKTADVVARNPRPTHGPGVAHESAGAASSTASSVRSCSAARTSS